jgi:hypothetical protein
MPSGSVRSYVQTYATSHTAFFFFFFFNQIALENMWILNLQETKPENVSKSFNMLFNKYGHGRMITNSIAIFWALTVQLCKPQMILISNDHKF